MSPRLILTRHAKSDWDDPTQDDIDRPLAPRGQAAAAALGRWMATAGFVPDEVLCSPARRTRETWAGIASGIAAAMPAPGAALRLVPALYRAAPDTLLEVLRTATGGTVLMLAHNPGIAAFAEMLPKAAPADPDFARYPTGATLVADFDAPGWAAIRPGTATLRAFTIPRRLG
ncbi:MAG: histidine phosphatase family protein [Rhodobacteraceae bacterium]|nr:histidine phosphatase family protein [Paracoccaceae bacterium]